MSVIIIGGGMAGVTLALAISHLSQGSLPVQLVEACPANSHQHPGFDDRAIALAQGTCQQLARIGAWQAIADTACPIHSVQVSDKGHLGLVTLNASDYHLAALGYVATLQNVGNRLFGLLQRAPGVTLHCPARVVGVNRTPDKASVTLDNGAILHGQLLVATDGSQSSVAHQCGIQWQQTPYQQLAVIATITTTVPNQYRAFERFTCHGPLALLPLSAHSCSLVWCHPLSQPDWQQHPVLSWTEQRFCDELQRAFGWRLGRITHADNRRAYPLTLSQARRMVTHRLALAGNAAHTLHPVAGQGFNLAMRDVISLAETLITAARKQQDVGRYTVLADWQQRRLADTSATICLTDGLIRLFANQWQPLVLGRNMALLAMNVVSPLRDQLAHRALGWVVR